MAQNDFKVIKADRKLQVKAGTGDVDRKAVERAETFVENNKVSYADVAAPILAQLSAAIASFKSAPNNAENARNIKTAIMNLKASAGTFHYPMISRLCTPLLLHLEEDEGIDRETLKIVELLYHIVSILVKNEESDIGAAIGKELESTFLLACKKISNRQRKKI